MGFRDRFRRNNQKSVLPDEVRQYYQSEKRQRRGVAIVLAILALIVTVAIACGLFFGGRAVYRHFKHDNKKEQGQTSSASTSKPSPEETKDQDTTQKPQTSGPSSPTPTTTPDSSRTTPAPTPTTTPSLGDQPSLPRTGDEGL